MLYLVTRTINIPLLPYMFFFQYHCYIWLWINTYENTIFIGMNIHFNPAMLMSTRGTIGFDTLPYMVLHGSHQYTPFILAYIYIYTSTSGSVMGYEPWNRGFFKKIPGRHSWHCMTFISCLAVHHSIEQLFWLDWFKGNFTGNHRFSH